MILIIVQKEHKQVYQRKKQKKNKKKFKAPVSLIMTPKPPITDLHDTLMLTNKLNKTYFNGSDITDRGWCAANKNIEERKSVS